jgi:hypothetical protein
VESERQSNRDGWTYTPKDWKDVMLELGNSQKRKVHLCPTCHVALFGAVDRIGNTSEEQIVNLIREIVVNEIDNR